MEAQVVDTILHQHPRDPSAIIQVLLDVQNELYYLPRDVLQYVSAYLHVPLSRTYHLATFYKAFSLKPRGKFPISVCTGTACHVQGAVNISDALTDELKTKDGETTEDGRFTVSSVACLGCCSLAPVMMVEENTFGRLTPDAARKVVRKYGK